MATEWCIEKIVPGGSGFTRLPDGRSAFASGALPGERVEVGELEDHRSYLVARSLRVLSPSAERVPPACPVATECGGCDFMHMSYEAQLRHKAAMLREALGRTAGIGSLPEFEVVPSPSRLRYRGRIRLQLEADGKIGFFARKSQRLVEIPGCLVAAEPLDAALATLRSIAARYGRKLGACEALEIRVAPAGAPLMLRLFPRRPGRRVASALLTALSAHFEVAVAGERSSIEQRWPLPGGAELSAPPSAFTQVNWDVNECLVRAVVDGALARSVLRFCDLYAGAGNFALALLHAGLSGVLVESERAALSAAERAAERQGLGSRARFVAGDVKHALGEVSRDEPFDLVVLDPPRSGAREILTQLIDLRPRAIAYSACDPVTLARDVKILTARGFALESVQAFDMFPQTHHFETLIWLVRTGA